MGLSMHCLARYLFILVVSVLGMGQMIVACGQKGDLYLAEPEEETSKDTSAGTGDGADTLEKLHRGESIQP
jgi:predicted small lipoprotein YifL